MEKADYICQMEYNLDEARGDGQNKARTITDLQDQMGSLKNDFSQVKEQKNNALNEVGKTANEPFSNTATRTLTLWWGSET